MTRRESRRNQKISPFSIPVHDPRKHIMGVGTSADEEQDDEKERLKVENCSLLYR